MGAYIFIDVSKKQEFIYRHNNLKQNLYSSGIIKAITENVDDENLKDILSELPVALSIFLKEKFNGCYTIKFSGGGNSIIHFNESDQAKKFIKKYSRAAIEHYPELELYISLVEEAELSEENKQDMKIIQKLLKQRSDQLKDSRRSVFKRWTYGIEAINDAGKPVSYTITKDNRVYSDEKLSKRVRNMVSSRLDTVLDEKSVKKVIELKQYRKQDDGKSYIGVIAIDGNRMGEMVSRLTTFEQLTIFSNIIHDLYFSAVMNALQLIAEHKKNYQKTKKTINSEHSPLFYTPIVLAGDDVCLITEGEYAIQLAAQIVNQIQHLSVSSTYRQKLEQLGIYEALTACAGISIVRVTYPFFESVKEAEELCRKAKDSIHTIQFEHSDDNLDHGGHAASFINWSIVEGQVRETNAYTDWVESRNLKQKYHIKPLRIDQQQAYEQGIISYNAFEKMIKEINSLSDQTSFIHQIKKTLYQGYENYQLLFEMNKNGKGKEFEQIVNKVFENCEVTVEGSVLKDIQESSYIYVLNDVLDALEFMKVMQEGPENAADTVSNASGTA